MNARSRHHACHSESSLTPPPRCVPGFACTQSPYTSRRRSSSGVGWYPGTSPAVPSLPSDGPGVVLYPADLASPSPVVSLPFRIRVVCGVALSFSRPHRRFRFPSPFPVSPSAFPLYVVPSRRVWEARLEHRPRHRHVTQTQAALRHSHCAVLHIDVSPHSQQASTARQAECTGAVVCYAGDFPFSFPLFPPSIFTVDHTRFAWPSPSLTPSIARGEVADITSVIRRVPRWPYVVPMRRFLRNFSRFVFLLPPFV